MFSSKMFSVGSICLLFALLLFGCFVGGVNAQDPTPTPSLSATVDVGGIVGVGSLFLLFGVLVLVVWVLAVVRGSVGMCALSSGLWIAFGFGLMIVGEPGNGFVVGFTYISFLLGIVMAVSMFWEIYRMTVKKRSVEGGIFA